MQLWKSINSGQYRSRIIQFLKFIPAVSLTLAFLLLTNEGYFIRDVT